MKKYLTLLLVMILAGTTFAFAQEDDSVLLKGKIEQISEDGSYITVGGQKVLTTKELVEEAYFELGDNVEIKAENSQEGLRALSYEYIYDEELGYDDDSEEVYPDQDY
ncbi:MAG: hypothetical protein K9L86_07040 [Candidatus Omnitrophica bacterium]|nr:hypothetical protein [Candidatus Omnitrophota bacterium]